MSSRHPCSLRFLVACLTASSACSGDLVVADGIVPGTDDDTAELATARGGRLGAPLRNLTDAEKARFEAGLEEFSAIEDVDEGLGPVFNDAGCGVCHLAGAIGGASDRTVTRFGRVTNGAFDPLAGLGGSLIQANGIGPQPATDVDGTSCDYVAETVPAEANVQAHRLTTPLFGLGLVDAVPDETLEALAAWQQDNKPELAGIVNHVVDAASGATRVGRFGWKAQVATLAVFSADAYLNEMGITSPLFPEENCPQGDCDLLRCDPVPDPEDDGEDVDKFEDFMTLLAPPPPGELSDAVIAGAEVFLRSGCATCHTPILETGPSEVSALSERRFRPFSDFLLHDMGALGDGIVQGNATGRLMRTAPLWGLSARTRFLHDGRATTIGDAIRAHDGQGARASSRFRSLGYRDARDLFAFLLAL